MTDKIGLDFYFKPDQPIGSELRSFAIGLKQLYQRAAETWPGQETSQDARFEDGVFKVDLTPFPEEVAAALAAMRNQSDRPI